MAPTTNGVNGVKPQVNGVQSSWQAKHELGSHFYGGNRLEKAPPSKVKDFVQAQDGHSVITSVSFIHAEVSAGTRGLTTVLDLDREQRHCSSQGDPIRTKMGLRDIRRRASHSVHGDGYTGRFGCKRRLYQNGRPIR